MLKFLVFSDLHYRKDALAITVDHLDEILKRASDENVDFVIQTGDFCVDYKRSPELINAYQNNKYGLATYGIYGNHEMEGGEENTMELITPTLCNRPVNFGKSGEPYWYTDIKNFRIIGLDTNYSFNPNTNEWEHNIPNSYGARPGNYPAACVSPDEMLWLENILSDTKLKGMKALVFSHHTMISEWYQYPNNADEVRDLLKKYSGTALMAINGDIHTDHFEIRDNIAYYDVNVALWADWIQNPDAPDPYEENLTYEFSEFDENGKLIKKYQRPYNTLKRKSLYHKNPLSAIVTVDELGNIDIKGMESEYIDGIKPNRNIDGVKPYIPNRKAKIKVDF